MIKRNLKQVYISREVADRLKEYCKEEGFIMTTYTNKVIDEHLKSLKK